MIVPLCPSKKRAIDSPFIPPRKRARYLGKSWQEILECPDIITSIGGFLGVQDLLHFESANKKIRQNAQSAWMKKQENYPDWSACQEEKNKYKWNVCLTAALQGFCSDKFSLYNPFKPDFKVAQAMSKRYSELIKRFPVFGSFFEIEILEYASQNPMISEELKQRQLQICKIALECKWGGELLLQTLIEIKNYQNNLENQVDSIRERVSLILDYVDEAIKKNAICVNRCVYDLLPLLNKEHDHLIDGLIFRAAEKGDFEIVELFLEDLHANYKGEAFINKTKALIEMGCRCPPILMRYAYEQSLLHAFDQNEIDSLYDEVLKAYGSQIPADKLLIIQEFKESHKLDVA